MTDTSPRGRLLPDGVGGRLGASALSGVLLFMAGEPLGWGFLAWVALVPLLVALLSEPRRARGFLYGLVFGLVFFAVHLSWIFLFGWMAWTALTLVLALYFGVAGLVATTVRRFPFAPAIVAGAWGGVELIRDRWPYGGYPWGTVGTTQASVAPVRWLAAAVGVYGLTFLIVFVAALVADRLVAGGWSLGSIALVGSMLLVVVVADTIVSGVRPEGRDLRMLVVQGGVPRPPRPDQRDTILESHARLTREAFDRLRERGREAPDIVVWPEDAVGIGVRGTADDEVSALARELRTPFLVGRTRIDAGDAINTIEHVTDGGERAGTYLKRHPVPFGEYVPISFFRRFVSTLNNEIPVDQRRGRTAVVFDVEGTDIATPICFESVFPRDIRDFTRKGAEVIVVSTNNASFERSYAAQQHLAHARMRAVENRQWIVQAALAGISGVLTPDGRVQHATRLFSSDVFVADVKAREARSLYAYTGDLFPAMFASLTLASIVLWLLTLVGGRIRRPRY